MPTPSTTSRGDATRRALLDAATTRFARDGYRTTSVADIARDADLGDTTAYVHFPNKEALFLAAVDRDVGALFIEVLSALQELKPTPRWAQELFAAVLHIVDDHPLARRLLAGLEPTITERTLESHAIDDLSATLAARVAAAQQGGRLRPDVSPDDLAEGLVGLVIATSMAAVQAGDSYLTRFGDGLTALFHATLVPDPRLGIAPKT